MTISELFEALKLEIKKSEDNIAKKIDKQDNRIKKLSQENKRLKARIEQLEQKQKKNNVVIFGLGLEEKETKQELLDKCLTTLNLKLGITLKKQDISDVYTFGKAGNKQIVLEFISSLSKREVLFNAKKLKGTGISVVQDRTKQEQLKNKILVYHLKEARSRNKKARIHRGRLIVDEEEFSVEDLEIPKEIGEAYTSQVTSEEEATCSEGEIEDTEKSTQQSETRGVKRRKTKSPKLLYRTRLRKKEASKLRTEVGQPDKKAIKGG